MYQQTRVLGFDLENVARTASIPLNYQFQRGNLLDGLPFASQQFQYVHQRVLVTGIPLEKWPFVVGELRRVAAPNGWVEMGTIFHQAGPATKQFLAWWASISATRSIDASKVAGIGTLLQNSGFSNVQTKTETIPIGSWGRRLGSLLACDILAGWPNIRPLAHRLLDVSPNAFNEVIACLENEWNTLQASYDVYFACGQV